MRKGYGQGVALADILDTVDIDPSHMFRFYIATKDNYKQDDGGVGAGTEAWYYNELCRTNRYYYPHMRECTSFDYGHVVIHESSYLRQDAEYVPSIIALRSSFVRLADLNDEAWETSNLGTGAGYRLMFGQTSPTLFGARDFAQQVIGIVCIVGGEDGTDVPEIVIPDEVQDVLKNAEVGTKIKFTPGLTNVHDALIADLGWRDIEFDYDADNGVYTLTKNDDGSVEITIVGECDEPITLGAHFGKGAEGFVSKNGWAVKGVAGRNPGEAPGSGSGGDAGDEGDEGNGGITTGDTGIKLEAGQTLFNAQLAGDPGTNGGETLFTDKRGDGSEDTDNDENTSDDSNSEDAANESTDAVDTSALHELTMNTTETGEATEAEDSTEPTDELLEQEPVEEQEPDKVDQQVYELEFDEVPLAAPPKQEKPWELCIFGGALAVAGGLVRGRRFSGALDKAVPVSKKDAA